MTFLLGHALTDILLESARFPGHGEEHIQWRESSIYRVHRNWLIVTSAWFTLLASAFGVGAAFAPEFLEFLKQRPGAQLGFLVIVTLVIALGPLLAAYVWFVDARGQFIERVRAGLLEDLAKKQKELKYDDNGRPNYGSLWDLTQDRINLYQSVATRQSETSFRIGIGATIAGFIAVIVLGVVAAFGKSGSPAIAASVVGVAGAAMTGYIGSTFMKAQTEASQQLQQFFLQPVEFFRLLGLERLLDLMSPEEKARAIQRIVDSMMPATNLTPVPNNSSAPIKKKGWVQRLVAGLRFAKS